MEKLDDKGFTKPAITRLARRAGVKSMSDDCTDVIRSLIAMRLDEILRSTVAINEQSSTKTIMVDDIYTAMQFSGLNVAKSDDIH
tara:strand:+ start:771 stop:1025 length:255 start_codon:yes stop_codon:yes gene_type:complete